MPAKKTETNPVLDKPYKMPKLKGKFFPQNNSYENTKDSWKVVYFYPKDLTSGCTTEANDFQLLQNEFKKYSCEIIGVSKDNLVSHEKFALKEGIKFLLLSDELGETCEAFGVWKEKSMYGKKYMGIERSTFLINPKGLVCAQWLGVKVAGHSQSVLDTLKALVSIGVGST
jgi:thioredoxin-dependent peroxiredoxin